MADTPPNSTAAAPKAVPKAPLKAPANAPVKVPVKAPEAASTTAAGKPTPSTKSRLKRAFSLARWALAIALIVAITLFVLARNNALPQGLQTTLSAATHTVSTAWRALFGEDRDAWQAYIDAQFTTLDASQTAWQTNLQENLARTQQATARAQQRTLQETETALAALRREAYANSVLINQWKRQLAAPESLTAIARHQVAIMQYQLAFGYAPHLVAEQIGHFLDFLRAHNAPNFNAIYEELQPIQQTLADTPTPQVTYWLRELDLAKRSLPLWVTAQNPTRNDNNHSVPAQNADTPNTPNTSNNLWARLGHIGQSLVRIEKTQAPSMGIAGIEGTGTTNAEHIALLAAHRLDYLQLSLLGLNLAQAQLQSAELLRFLDTYLITDEPANTPPGLKALTDTLQAINAYDTQAASVALTNTLSLLTPQNAP